jgi:hypothetical protein
MPDRYIEQINLIIANLHEERSMSVYDNIKMCDPDEAYDWGFISGIQSALITYKQHSKEAV